jgi:RNA polymerase sigma factor (TIGR02999 family)
VDPTIADLVASTDGGDPAAADALFAALYRELHQLARRQLARGGGQLTLGATTLLHEAYLDMSGRTGTSFPDRPRFMGYAARVMRSLIVDHARQRRALKRGGGFEITALETAWTWRRPRWRSSMP